MYVGRSISGSVESYVASEAPLATDQSLWQCQWQIFFPLSDLLSLPFSHAFFCPSSIIGPI